MRVLNSSPEKRALKHITDIIKDNFKHYVGEAPDGSTAYDGLLDQFYRRVLRGDKDETPKRKKEK